MFKCYFFANVEDLVIWNIFYIYFKHFREKNYGFNVILKMFNRERLVINRLIDNLSE